jgi:hypothetical protein
VVAHVSPTDPEEEVAANLALSMRSAGFEVAVVDTRLEGRMPTRFGAGTEPRLPAVLNTRDYREVPFAREHGVIVVPADDNPAALRDRLAGAQFRNLLRDLRGRNDYVLVAAPSAATADGAAVALAGDHMLLTVVDGVTTRDDLHDVLDQAERLGIDVIGIVVTPRRRRFLGVLPRRPAKPAKQRRTVKRAEPTAVTVPGGSGTALAAPTSSAHDRTLKGPAVQPAGRGLRARRDAARAGGRPDGSGTGGTPESRTSPDPGAHDSMNEAGASVGDSQLTNDGG